ncbi:MAG: hypothetical protein EON88_00005, partial [Brevundimonas sp.]
MRKKKNASGHRLDPARRDGDTVGVLAADALRVAAGLLDSIESDAVAPRESLVDDARVCRVMAEAV